MYDFTTLKEQISDAQEWLKREYTGIRTGRATPAVLDNIRVELYGSRMPVNQAATITTEDARTIRIVPWDAGTVKTIEKAITDADLGLSVSDDEKGIRVSFPELTAEVRERLAKLAKQKLEDARITLRRARDEAWGDIQEREKAREISEDDKFRAKDEMQKLIDAGNAALDGLAENKEKEIKN